ncbi:TetR/AcrR family transcriptional regulator [Nocardia miyunensis]|uniref:TetR/AcrR family transcriptional regulator n=1 Tax=Nocardia miyunensis TaxID=282684 RepID=UPI00083493A2|nr:TetR/AcrR family transcriptional regulator [Nocardia miyunensis]
MSREQKILEAAEKLFSERSFDGVGVDAIGKEAGVTGSAIYRHFSNKEEILAVLFDQATDALLVRLGEPADDPRDELVRLVRAHVEFSVTYHRLAAIWAREQRTLTQANQRNILRRQRNYTDRWIEALDRCYPGHPRTDLASTVRALHALITSDATRPPGGKRSPELQTLLTNLALSALDGLVQPAAEAAG